MTRWAMPGGRHGEGPGQRRSWPPALVTIDRVDALRDARQVEGRRQLRERVERHRAGRVDRVPAAGTSSTDVVLLKPEPVRVSVAVAARRPTGRAPRVLSWIGVPVAVRVNAAGRRAPTRRRPGCTRCPAPPRGRATAGWPTTPSASCIVIRRGRRRAELGVELVDVGRGAVLEADEQRLRRGHAHREELGLAAAGQGPVVGAPERQVGHRGLLQLEGVRAALPAGAVGGQHVRAASTAA